MKRLMALGLILVGLVWLAPVYFTVQTSFISTFTSPFNLWGRAHLENWRALPWSVLGRYALNSAIVCGTTTLLAPLVCVSAGYAFVRYRFPGKDMIFYAFLLAIALPGVVLFLPRYLLIAKVGLVNSRAGLVLPVIMSPAAVFLARQYLAQIDISVVEAARLDGASELQILRHIIFPLSIPLIILVMMSGFSASYGDFMWQYLVGRDIRTLTSGIGIFLLSTAGNEMGDVRTLVSNYKMISEESLRAAASTLQVLPQIILFILGQKYFIKGIKL